MKKHRSRYHFLFRSSIIRKNVHLLALVDRLRLYFALHIHVIFDAISLTIKTLRTKSGDAENFNTFAGNEKLATGVRL